MGVKGFTSETAKAVRAMTLAKQTTRFDRAGWKRRWMRRERARRKAVGVCVRCGDGLVEVYASCLPCRVKYARWAKAERTKKRRSGNLHHGLLNTTLSLNALTD